MNDETLNEMAGFEPNCLEQGKTQKHQNLDPKPKTLIGFPITKNLLQ
jgi:hypothetical protein